MDSGSMIASEVVGGLLTMVFSLIPLVLVLLALKWLYESKKSLAEISAALKELKEQMPAGNPSREDDHE